MEMKRKAISLVACILAIAGLSGCTSESNQGSTDTTSQAGGQQTVDGSSQTDRYEITYAAWTSGPIVDNSIAETAIEEKFPNVDIIPLAFERASWQEQINTRVAGGDIPDIIFRDSRTLLEQYVQQGIVCEIPIEMLKEFAPDIYTGIAEYGYDTWLSSYFDGKIYGFPSTTINNTMPFTNGIRKDWLDEAGIDKVPETLEEYEEAFAAFAANGHYALTANGMSGMSNAFSFVYGAYGVFPDKWMLTEDGSGVEYGLVSQRSKQALETLANWYQAGYIDPEFVTDDAAKGKEKWANGQVGYIETTWNRLISGKEMYTALMDIDPNAEIAFAPAPIGPDGEHGYSHWGRIAGSFAFGKHLEQDQEKFALCLQVMNALASDEQLYLETHYGIEGTHWEKDSELGIPTPINGYHDSEKKAEIGNALLWGLPLPDVQKACDLPQNLDELTKMATDATMRDNEQYFNYVGNLMPADVLTEADPASQMQARWTIDFITGNAPISEFDTFVSEWMAAGGDKLTEVANEVYRSGVEQMNEIEELMK